jgi:hypothetical protein
VITSPSAKRIATATGMIKSAAGAASYLTSRVSRRGEQDERLEGIIDGAGLAKEDPRLQFRPVMFAMARKQAGQVLRRRDTCEHVALYLKAFNAWRDNELLTQLRFTSREEMPRVTKARQAGPTNLLSGRELPQTGSPLL